MTEAIKQRGLIPVQPLPAAFKTSEGGRDQSPAASAQAPLKASWQRLQTIPGSGWLTAARLLAQLGELERFAQVGSLGSALGLSIKEPRAGSSVRGNAQMDRHGRRDLRPRREMSAVVAKGVRLPRHGWAKRLQAAGKPTKNILSAIIGQLLPIV